jgi:peptidylprolyl isomerase
MVLRHVVMAAAAVAAIAAPAFAKQDKNAPVPYDIVKNAPADAWRGLDPENTLLLDLPAGQVVIELRPDLAPLHVERIKMLARAKFYDGLKFHRVIEGFVAQGGDPKGDGTGGSTLPDIKAEFAGDTAKLTNFVAIGRDRTAARVGFIDGLPAAAQPEALRSFLAEKSVKVWGAHCPGAMSMARSTPPDSANSQFFLVIGDARQSLDTRYTVWGYIVDGFDHTRRINRGEPPAKPTTIMRMRIAADVPPEKRPKLEVMRTESPAFKSFVDAMRLRREDGFVRDLCDIKAPRRSGEELKF